MSDGLKKTNVNLLRQIKCQLRKICVVLGTIDDYFSWEAKFDLASYEYLRHGESFPFIINVKVPCGWHDKHMTF